VAILIKPVRRHVLTTHLVIPRIWRPFIILPKQWLLTAQRAEHHTPHYTPHHKHKQTSPYAR